MDLGSSELCTCSCRLWRWLCCLIGTLSSFSLPLQVYQCEASPLMKGPLHTIDLSNDEEEGDRSDMPLVLPRDLLWGAVWSGSQSQRWSLTGPFKVQRDGVFFGCTLKKGIGQLSVKAASAGAGRPFFMLMNSISLWEMAKLWFHISTAVRSQTPLTPPPLSIQN